MMMAEPSPCAKMANIYTYVFRDVERERDIINMINNIYIYIYEYIYIYTYIPGTYMCMLFPFICIHIAYIHDIVHIAYCVLPIASCLRPIANCLLPTVLPKFFWKI